MAGRNWFLSLGFTPLPSILFEFRLSPTHPPGFFFSERSFYCLLKPPPPLPHTEYQLPANGCGLVPSPFVPAFKIDHFRVSFYFKPEKAGRSSACISNFHNEAPLLSNVQIKLQASRY